MNLLEKRLTGQSGGKILDVATEAGWFIKTLKEAFKDFDEAIGIDISDEDFATGRETFKDDPVSFVVMDGTALKFDDASFDTVSVSAGLHHMENIPAVLSEMIRVLKPGGWFILHEGFRDNQDEKQVGDVMEHDWYAKVDRLLGKPHFPTLKKQEIIDLIENLGLKQFEFQERRCDCPRATGETVEKELAEMSEHLERIKDHPRYQELKSEREIVVERINSVGVACQSYIEVIGIK